MNCCLLVICVFLFIALMLPSPSAAGVPGAPQNIEDFATRKLKLANNGLLKSCRIEPVVGTFTRQVVAGLLFQFDLKIAGSSYTCPITAPETCRIAVVSQPWLNPALQVLDGAPDNTLRSCDKLQITL